jgi:BRCT domain type II-containing protein
MTPREFTASEPRPLDGLHFVITGSFGESRDSIVKKLVALGAERYWSIDHPKRPPNLLIAGDEPGPAKVRKAKALGINIADRAWLVGALALGGFTLADNDIKVETV